MTKIGTKCPSWLPIIRQQPIFQMLSFLLFQNAQDDLVEDDIAEELPAPAMVPRPHGVPRPLPYQGQNPMASYQHHQQPQGGYQVCPLTQSNCIFLGGGIIDLSSKGYCFFPINKAAPLHWSWTIDGLSELNALNFASTFALRDAMTLSSLLCYALWSQYTALLKPLQPK